MGNFRVFSTLTKSNDIADQSLSPQGRKMMDFFDPLRREFQSLVETHEWQGRTIDVRVKTLKPEEAIGNPEHNDYPIIKGRERMMEAEFLGERGQAFTDMYGNFVGTLGDVSSMSLDNNYRRAVFLATLNAVSRHLGIVDKTIHCKDEDPPKCSKELALYVTKNFSRPKIALVGLQPRMAESLAREFDVRVTDLDPDNIGTTKFGISILGPEHTIANIEWSDLVIATGSTLTNDTLCEVIGKKPAIVYGVTIAAPAHFLKLTRFCPYGT